MFFAIDNCAINIEYDGEKIEIMVAFSRFIYKKKIRKSTVLGNTTFDDGSLEQFYKVITKALYNYSTYEKEKEMYFIFMREFAQIDLCKHKANMTIMWVKNSITNMVCISISLDRTYGNKLCHLCSKFLQEKIKEIEKNRPRLYWKCEGFTAGTEPFIPHYF